MVNDVFSQRQELLPLYASCKGAMKGAGSVELVSNVRSVFFYVFLSRHWLKWLDVCRAALRILVEGSARGAGAHRYGAVWLWECSQESRCTAVLGKELT